MWHRSRPLSSGLSAQNLLAAAQQLSERSAISAQFSRESASFATKTLLEDYKHQKIAFLVSSLLKRRIAVLNRSDR